MRTISALSIRYCWCNVVKHAAIWGLSLSLSKNNSEKWWMVEDCSTPPPMLIIGSYLWLHDNTTWEPPARAATCWVSPSSSTWTTNRQETVSFLLWSAALHLHTCTRFSCVKASWLTCKSNYSLLSFWLSLYYTCMSTGATNPVKPTLKFENSDNDWKNVNL